MEEKFFTFLYFPGTHGKPRKIRLPYYVVQLLLGFSLVGMITVVALAGSYTRMLLKVSTFNSLRSESEALKTQNRVLSYVASQANAKLYSLQSLAAEVALTYGLGNSRRPRFPSSVLVLATGHHDGSEAGYSASLQAFNVLRTTRLLSPKIPLLQTSLLDPLNDEGVTPSIWPVRGRITAGFGQRMDPFTGEGAFHSGIDIAAPVGTQVQAAADGILFLAGPDGSFGNEVEIDHGYGFTTKYGHLKTTYVAIGQEVKRGQVIGAVGSTGRSTGPHLHYEVRIYDTAVNPAKYLPGSLLRRGEPFKHQGMTAQNQTSAPDWSLPNSSQAIPSTGGQ